MKFIGKVVVAFAVWVVLGFLVNAVWPEAHAKYGMMLSEATSEEIAQLQQQYSNITSTLVDMGLRKEDEIVVSDKKETRFTGTYGNISHITLDLSLAKSPSSSSTSLRLWVRYEYPRWKDGGSADHRILKAKLKSMMKESEPNKSLQTTSAP